MGNLQTCLVVLYLLAGPRFQLGKLQHIAALVYNCVCLFR